MRQSTLLLAAVVVVAALPTGLPEVGSGGQQCDGADGQCGAAESSRATAAHAQPGPGAAAQTQQEVMRQRMLASKRRREGVAALKRGEMAAARTLLEEALSLTPQDQGLIGLLSQVEDPAVRVEEDRRGSAEAEATAHSPPPPPPSPQKTPPRPPPKAPPPPPPLQQQTPISTTPSAPMPPPRSASAAPAAEPAPGRRRLDVSTSGGDPDEDLSRTFYRVDEGGAVAFRTTPNMDDRSNAVAASGAFVEAAREPPEFPGWVQSGSAASFGLWLPKTYLLPVQHNSEEHREALWAASAEEEAEEAREQEEVVGCADGSVHCSVWAAARECEKDPEYMIPLCRVSCGICRAGQPLEPAQDAAVRQMIGLYKSDQARRTGRKEVADDPKSGERRRALLAESNKTPELPTRATGRLRAGGAAAQMPPPLPPPPPPPPPAQPPPPPPTQPPGITTHELATAAGEQEGATGSATGDKGRRTLQEEEEILIEKRFQGLKAAESSRATAAHAQPGPGAAAQTQQEVTRQRMLASKRRREGVAALKRGEMAAARTLLEEALSLTPQDQGLIGLLSQVEDPAVRVEEDRRGSAEAEATAHSPPPPPPPPPPPKALPPPQPEQQATAGAVATLPDGWSAGSLPDGTPFYYAIDKPTEILWEPP